MKFISTNTVSQFFVSHHWVSILLVSLALFAGTSHAGLISTHSMTQKSAPLQISSESPIALAKANLVDKYSGLGVDNQVISARLSSLTNDELYALNQEIESAPSGQGAGGILLAVFLVFVVTDMLCATDVFGFVKCINK